VYSCVFYSPDEQLIRLLKTAFRQRLIFKVDNNNRVVWNVLHCL